jgi:hypothetical protein
MPAAVRCPKCQAQLPPETLNAPEFRPCPACGAPVRADVFAALEVPVPIGQAGERIVALDQASCFFHVNKKAVVPCEQCGRFLCALCDCDLNGRHFCPGCLESGRRTETIAGLEEARVLYDRQALLLAVVPLGITALAAFYVAIRYWHHPGSLVAPSRWRMPAALALAGLQVLVLGWVILYAASP